MNFMKRVDNDFVFNDSIFVNDSFEIDSDFDFLEVAELQTLH